MEAGPPVYQYVTFDPGLLFDQQALIPLGMSAIEGKLWDLLRGTGISRDDYVIDAFPLVRFYPGKSDREPAPTPPHVPQKVFSVRSPSPAAADNFRRAINSLRGPGLQSIAANPVVAK